MRVDTIAKLKKALPDLEKEVYCFNHFISYGIMS